MSEHLTRAINRAGHFAHTELAEAMCNAAG
jgi:hypothetical protein